MRQTWAVERQRAAVGRQLPPLPPRTPTPVPVCARTKAAEELRSWVGPCGDVTSGKSGRE